MGVLLPMLHMQPCRQLAPAVTSPGRSLPEACWGLEWQRTEKTLRTEPREWLPGGQQASDSYNTGCMGPALRDRTLRQLRGRAHRAVPGALEGLPLANT